ncbi:uncharacterized protein V1516DRAFT_47984 [Lipomyces oligophaga]|uniref:uncharacterized protein n=1 Tax=Lipomyces oligophaga TaxID=45792 RepID=UPI0034CF8834
MRLLLPAVSGRELVFSVLSYVARAAPGLSTVVVISIVCLTLSAYWTMQGYFILLTLFLHLSVVGFAVRSCYGMYITRREMAHTADEDQRSRTAAGEEDILPTVHAIFIPCYKESLETLRETLSMLASHPNALLRYDVYLAMEAAENESQTKAAIIVQEFSYMFRYMTFTVHPADLVGEVRGKSSNLSWATRIGSRRYSSQRETDVVVTIMDADTHLLPSYFGSISRYCSTIPGNANGLLVMFVVPVVFDRNAHATAPLVRCADLLWCSAGISALYETSRVRTPTSVYSVSLRLARFVDFWDTDQSAIGEDLHMYLKCFFRTRGKLLSVSIFSPASHCNVDYEGSNNERTLSRANTADRWWKSCVARFAQARRHMWGMLDSGYAICEAARVIGGYGLRGDTRFRRLEPHIDLEYLEDRKLRNAIHDDKEDLGQGDTIPPIVDNRLPVWRTIVLLHRLFEAHFLPVHYFIDVLACSWLDLFGHEYKATSPFLQWTLEISSFLRTAAFCLVVVQLLLYERFHAAALALRISAVHEGLIRNSSDRIINASLRNVRISPRNFLANAADYVLFPVAGTIFGAVPAVMAQVMQFWTTDFVYHVSAKPVTDNR